MLRSGVFAFTSFPNCARQGSCSDLAFARKDYNKCHGVSQGTQSGQGKEINARRNERGSQRLQPALAFVLRRNHALFFRPASNLGASQRRMRPGKPGIKAVKAVLM